MYENAVPVYEMKNKLSFFLHKVDDGEDVFISVRGEPSYQILTIDDVEQLKATAPKEKTPYEVACELRKELGIEDDNDFDLNDFIESIKPDSAFESYRTRQMLYELSKEDKE